MSSRLKPANQLVNYKFSSLKNVYWSSWCVELSTPPPRTTLTSSPINWTPSSLRLLTVTVCGRNGGSTYPHVVTTAGCRTMPSTRKGKDMNSRNKFDKLLSVTQQLYNNRIRTAANQPRRCWWSEIRNIVHLTRQIRYTSSPDHHPPDEIWWWLHSAFERLHNILRRNIRIIKLVISPDQVSEIHLKIGCSLTSDTSFRCSPTSRLDRWDLQDYKMIPYKMIPLMTVQSSPVDSIPISTAVIKTCLDVIVSLIVRLVTLCLSVKAKIKTGACIGLRRC